MVGVSAAHKGFVLVLRAGDLFLGSCGHLSLHAGGCLGVVSLASWWYWQCGIFTIGCVLLAAVQDFVKIDTHW